MKRTKLTREDLIQRIEDKYINESEYLSLEPEFIIDMYINGFKGIKNYTDQDLMDVFDTKLNPASIETIGNGWFEVEFNDDDNYDDDDDSDIYDDYDDYDSSNKW